MSIFNSSNYRDYLRNYLKSLPNNGRGELTKIARHLSVNTTLLSQILSGTRDFNHEQTYELSKYLGHSEIEMDYFSLLVRFERAGNHSFKAHLQKKIENLKLEAQALSRRIVHEKKLTETQQAIFYSTWLYSAIHLFLSTQPAGYSLDEISTRFGCARSKTAEIIHFLISAGLCVENSGKYKIGTLSTFVPQGSPFLLKHHANWRIKAIQKSEALSDNEMMYTGQVSLSRKDFDLIRKQLAELLNNIMKTVKDSPAEDIASLNIDWFWLEK